MDTDARFARQKNGLWVKVYSFEGHEKLQAGLQGQLDQDETAKRTVYGERFWAFGDIDAAHSVSSVILGQIAKHPNDFVDLDCLVNSATLDGEHQVGILSLIAKAERNQRFAGRIVDNLIEATNQDIAVLRSPYQLPLQIEE